jgi:hypothetical protein
MTDDQFKKMMAMFEVATQYSAVIAAQGQLQRPLTDEEYDQCCADVRMTADLLTSNLEVGVLSPDVWRPPFWRR